MLSKKNFLVLLPIIILSINSKAQLQTDYSPMKSVGKIPDEFITTIKGKYQNSLKSINKKEKSKVKKDKQEFLLESNNQVDLILKSGKVVFQEPVSLYLNKLADKIFAGDNSLRKQLKFYPAKFENANAYAYNEGFIFVQIGLIARCQNEAELAFILGHETGHYLKKHSINRHNETKKAQRSEGTYRYSSNDDKIKSIREYSRENETEADEIGFDYLRKAGYNGYAAASALNGLRSSTSPVYNTAFQPSILEVGLIRIPSAYLLQNDINQKNDVQEETDEKADEEEENDDVFSTHPSLDKRIDNLLSDLKVSDTIGKPNYIVSQTEFENVRELCRFELCRIYLINDDLDMAFYHINCLLQKYPNNAYLKRMMSATLYRIANASNNNKLSKKITPLTKASEELKASNYMIRKMQKEELNLLAIRYAWYVHESTPKHFDTEQLIDVSITNYTSNFARKINDFADSKDFSRQIVESYYVPDTADAIKIKDKKGKIKKGKIKKQVYWFDRSLSRFAFSDLKQNNEFIKRYETVSEANPDRKTRNSVDSKEEEAESTKKEDKKTIKEGKQKLTVSNVKNLILIEPEYVLKDNRKDIKIDYLANEQKEVELRELLKTCASQVDFNLVLMAANNIKSKDTTLFNDYSTLKEWVSEYFDNDESNTLATDYQRIKEISNRYDSRYAALFINVSTINKPSKLGIITAAVLTVYLPPIFLPYLIYKCLPEKDCSFVLIVLDMQENKMIHGNILQFDRKDREDLLKSQIYATMLSLKGKGEK